MSLCGASERVFIFTVVLYFIVIQSGNFWVHTRMYVCMYVCIIAFLFRFAPGACRMHLIL
jgi:hypothetical protein